MSNFNFDITDYSVFSDAIKTVENSKTILNDNLLDINQNIMSVNSADVFLGPICNSAMEGWGTVSTQLKQTIEQLNGATAYLNSASSTYQSSDNQNSQSIGGIQ